MSTYSILIADSLGKAGLDELASASDVLIIDGSSFDTAAKLEAIADVDALIIRSGTTVDKDMLEAAQQLKVIGRAGVGVDNVDLPEATKRGVMVANTPRANTCLLYTSDAADE